MTAIGLQGLGTSPPATTSSAAGKRAASTRKATHRRLRPAAGPSLVEPVVGEIARAGVPKGSPFRGLGAWVDLYDFDSLDARPTVARLRARGVRTLYIQTGRSNTPWAVSPTAGRWLVAAHRAGLDVVGWYLPYYRNLALDVRRSVAVERYRKAGQRFDGVGVDVEFRGAVGNQRLWMRRVARHQRILDRELRVPVASIVPTPLQMQVAPEYWAGFPWREIGHHADAILLMSYWSDRSGCPKVRVHCAYEFTALNVSLTRRLAGDRDVLIHVIGGVGDRISAGQLTAFVNGALSAGADGASIYDIVTTRPLWWRALSRLRTLGRRGRGAAR